MKKTTTKKRIPTKKSLPLAAKVTPSVTSVSTQKKIATKPTSKKTTPAKASPTTKKRTPGKVSVTKSTPLSKKITAIKQSVMVKSDNNSSKTSMKNSPKEGVKMLGLLHLVGNILSGGTLGIILVIAYLLIKKDTLSALEKETCYEIINFNLSFIIYMWVSMLLIALIVGLLLAPIVGITWLVLLIMWFLRHLVGENYRYPLTIRFIS